MKTLFHLILISIISLFLSSCSNKPSGSAAYESITAEDLEFHLNFLASDEFNGRDTPSAELKIASVYLASLSEHYKLSTIMPDTSYYQNIALKTICVRDDSYLKLNTGGKQINLSYAIDYSPCGSSLMNQDLNSPIVFLGYGFQSPDMSWDDIGETEINGKAVIILDPVLPDDHILKGEETRMLLRKRSEMLIEKGAALVLKAVGAEREEWYAENNRHFDDWSVSYMSDFNDKPEPLSGNIIELRYKAAAEILGISIQELIKLENQLKDGRQLKSYSLKNKSLDFHIAVKLKNDVSRNVLALVEGSDPELKNEYIIIGAHYDHIGAREGKIYNGANDNGSGTVALIELAEALAVSPPARSVIMAWFTGEEKGLWGSEYLAANPPVPIEQIKGCINLDVVSGFDLEKITVIGNMADFPGLNENILDIAEKDFQIRADYMEDNLRMQEFFYTHSDQYPFIKKGIPSVWLGAESDEQGHIHQPSDITANICFEKLVLVTQFSYLLALRMAN